MLRFVLLRNIVDFHSIFYCFSIKSLAYLIYPKTSLVFEYLLDGLFLIKRAQSIKIYHSILFNQTFF